MTATAAKPLTVALDAMGGDDAPAMVIEGAEIALLSRQKREELEALVSRIEHVELETDPDFFAGRTDQCFCHLTISIPGACRAV